MRHRTPPFLAALLGAAIFVALSVMGILRYRAGNAGFFDLGIAEHIAYNLAFRGDLSSLLQGHARPFFLVLAPFYRLFASAETLLIAGAGAVALATAPVYLLGKRAKGPWLGLWLVVLYFLHPGTWFLGLSDFHTDAFFPFLAGLSVLFLERNKGGLFLVFGLSLLLLKEPLALSAGVLGLVAWTKGLKKEGLVLASVSGAWFLAASFWLVPAFNPQGPYTRFFGPPWFSWEKALYWLMLFLPLGFLPLLRPRELAPGLVHAFLIIFAWFPGYYGLQGHYAGPFLIFGLWALGLALGRMNWKRVVPGLVGLALISHAAWAPTPLGLGFYNPQNPFNRWIYRASPRVRAVASALRENLPRDSSACVQINLILGGVPQREKLWAFPLGLDSAAYVVLDTATGRWVGMWKDPQGYRAWVRRVLGDPRWEPVHEGQGGLFILKRK